MTLPTNDQIDQMRRDLLSEQFRLLGEISLKQLIRGWVEQVEERLMTAVAGAVDEKVALFLRICRLLTLDGEAAELPATLRDRLEDGARLLLLGAGIGRDHPALGGLHAELAVVRAVCARRQGLGWTGLAQEAVAGELADTGCLSPRQRLMLADVRLRAGEVIAARAGYERALAEAAHLADRVAAARGVLRACRLVGAAEDWQVWRDRLEAEFSGILTSAGVDLEWESLFRRAVADRRPQSLILASGPKRPHRRLLPLLVTSLWRVALGETLDRDDLPNERTLRRLIQKDDVDPSEWTAASALLVAFEGCLTGESTAAALAGLLDAAARGPDVEVELLTMAAVAARLERLPAGQGGGVLAARVRDHYRAECRRLSAGREDDLYQVFAAGGAGRGAVRDLEAADLKTLTQMLRMSGFALGTAAAVAGSKVRRALGQAQVTDDEAEGHAARLRGFLAQAKGPILKISQALAFAEAALPPKIAAELTRAVAESPPLDHRIATRFVEQELGRPVSELYAEWAPYPVATASLGQVHRARLHDGRPVAVKVQYPHVREQVVRQMTALNVLAPLIGLFFPKVNVRRVIGEAARMLASECDYRLEAAMQLQVGRALAGFDGIRVPEVIPTHSNDRILTMDFVDGLRFYEFRRAVDDTERSAAAQRIFRAHFELRYRHGLINFDPHPGNYLFGDGYVALVDFGCYRRSESDIDRAYLRMIDAAATGSEERVAGVLAECGFIGSRREFDPAAAARQLVNELRPYYEDREFTFEADYLTPTFQEIARNIRAWSLPERWLAHLRSGAGLASLLVQLRATGNWHRLLREAVGDAWQDEEAADPAALPRAG